MKYTKSMEIMRSHMYDWMAKYRKDHGMSKKRFSLGTYIPFDIMKTYAAGMDAASNSVSIYEKFVKD